MFVTTKSWPGDNISRTSSHPLVLNSFTYSSVMCPEPLTTLRIMGTMVLLSHWKLSLKSHLLFHYLEELKSFPINHYPLHMIQLRWLRLRADTISGQKHRYSEGSLTGWPFSEMSRGTLLRPMMSVFIMFIVPAMNSSCGTCLKSNKEKNYLPLWRVLPPLHEWVHILW